MQHELLLRAPEALVEQVSDALLLELGALSVSVEDADAGGAAERSLFGEPGLPAPAAGWQRSTLRALFASEAEATDAATLLLAQDWSVGVEAGELQPVPEQDWVRLTQSQFAPVEITPAFWVVPSWHAPPAGAEKKIIRLDPGLAFGTGTHATTRMCLRWIAQHAEAMTGRSRIDLSASGGGSSRSGGPAGAATWARVLDYGCGSGILAIGAALHGAQVIDAVDIDPAAVAATQANALANGVTLGSGAPEQAQGIYSLVLANILAAPLKLLAPLLCGHVAPGGHLVLAGILERQADELRAAYAPWCTLGVHDVEDGWVLMTARRA